MFSRNGNRLSNSCKKDGRSCSDSKCNGYNHPKGTATTVAVQTGTAMDAITTAVARNGRNSRGSLRDFNN
ncbi:hypothetical protein EV182_000968 [Spiromyces aspiralis]|uniref:Uncharacterized protein n=1 Tax=Spiromyces aspiralis TaxID=68401 RepID=A0ACC1HJN9_9FUNG|nr:hypothetical protein EV182_000968 [Spiromyces aspiralis]